LVRLKVCYNACLPGKQLLLGKLIGSSGCADVYEGSAVVVDSNGDLQAGEVAAAAAAAAAAGTVQLSSISSFAVKVSRVSTPGVDCSTPSSRTARELHALKVLRGHPLAVQLAAEGRLVCHGNCSAAGDSEIPASSSQTASANTDAGHVSRSMLAAGTASWSAGSSPQTVSCIVMELAQMSLQEMLQRTGRCSEPHAGFVAMQLLKLLQIVQSGELGCTLVHGDITPGNVLVFADGRVALADFGVCQITKSTAAAAAAPPEMHTSVGTAYYAAVDACGSSGAAIADPVPHSSSAAAAAAAGIASADGGQGDKHGSSSSSSSSSEDDRHGYDASVDVFGVGVLVLEMLIGDLDGLFQHGPLDLSQLLLSQEQLGRVVDGEVPLPYGVVASAGALQFIGCCCGVGRKREAAAARGKPKRLTPAQLMASSPWLRYGAS
jgi:serine/threonine protein kinase